MEPEPITIWRIQKRKPQPKTLGLFYARYIHSGIVVKSSTYFVTGRIYDT